MIHRLLLIYRDGLWSILQLQLQLTPEPFHHQVEAGKPADDSGAFAELNKVLEQLGKVIAKLHDGGVVHGDLTTSNLIIRTLDGALVCCCRC